MISGLLFLIVSAIAIGSPYPSCSNTFTIDYVERTDIYIQHIDGTLYTTDQWTSGGYANEDANGVAIVRPVSGSFVIAKEQASSTLKWGGYGTSISGIGTFTEESTAVLDNDGAGNTPKIIKQLAGFTDRFDTVGAPAAEYCAGYTFSNGKTGYLGALGEWRAAYNNKTKVNEAMSLIGGTAMTDVYWTSTLYDRNNSWMHSWSSNSFGSFDRGYAFYARAFCLLS